MASVSCPRLIEVALPIREISAESVRDKSLRHGHISTLHLWWARRPLPASRAVVFASLVPDPDHPECPDDFRKLVEKHLKTNVPTALRTYSRGRSNKNDPDPYRPYDGLADTLRNRLLMFVAKWSPEMIEFEAGKSGKMPAPALLLDDRSLVKWEASDPDNHQGREILCIARELVHAAYGGKAPTVLDPFAGGGAIPLEAGRLGCQPIANDYNPVAYLILRATCEFPQRYGKPGRRKRVVEEFGKKVEREMDVANVLVHDVEQWANWILERAREKIGHLYPRGKDNRPVVGYFWARSAPCSNPSCRGEIPLLRSLLICNLRNGLRKTALTMKVNKISKQVSFGIAKGNDIEETNGTMQNRGNVCCPYCEQVTPVADLRSAGLMGHMGERMVAVILEGPGGKDYRPVEDSDLFAFEKAVSIEVERPGEFILPEITNSEDDVSNSTGIRVHLYGMKTWGSLFNPRQLVAMQTFVDCLHDALSSMQEEIGDEEYRRAIGIYLGILIDRIAQRGSNVGLWHTGQETFEHPFGRQAIPMTWDYPEANPFSDFAQKTLGTDYFSKVINHESSSGLAAKVTCSDGSLLTVNNGIADVIVTDPPYFDAIAYSDLSDYFYVWLRRGLGEVFPDILLTPLTPKADEATALKHRHQGDVDNAENHFKTKLAGVLRKAHKVMKPGGVISVMFAHQSTKAWTALVKAIFDANLTIDATWAIDTEKIYALKTGKAVLSTSITVICRSRVFGSAASFKVVRKEIEQVVAESVKRFWSYGFRGADLIVACYGPAVGVFGKYERVEKADGSTVSIPELLDLARLAARDAIAGEFRGDNLSTLYYVWANLYGAGEQAWDDARLVVQIGGESDNAMEVARSHGIFVIDGAICRLAMLADRSDRRNLGEGENVPLIDALHRALLLWQEEKRPELVGYLSGRDLLEDGPFWKLAQALFEVLPRDIPDWKMVSAILAERQTLVFEGRKATPQQTQTRLF